ncbi:metal ABC transporter permease [Ferrovibrio sp.]|uniref:metal ABC transporter permease n=1 Tax=Ferrovibrio sp. TaxID=1917215 RepID=UPI001B53499A|nr:metal ABC transporter permease [Ferrovibrio sp.]MBP7064923.1 metal ABC transporter permease [Ferrovibrio sp.]
MLFEFFIAPFAEFAFMKRALVACLALALGSAPIGVILMLRRMSLFGEAMSHAILPGAAVGFMIAGFSLPAISIGGVIAGLVVVLAAGAATRATDGREDASVAAFYLIALALGVTLISTRGSSVDVMHILFGTVLAVDEAALLLLGAVSSVSLLLLAALYRPLLLDGFDPEFLRSLRGPGGGAVYHLIFLGLVVVNLVAAFQAMGSLMAVGLMMLPAVAVRFWARSLPGMMIGAAAIAAVAGYAGLLLSFHANLPSGPAIVLACGAIYLVSLLFGRVQGLALRLLRAPHLEA